jgi:hypothetical protein
MTTADRLRRPVIAVAAIVVVWSAARCFASGSSSAATLPPFASSGPSVSAPGSPPPDANAGISGPPPTVPVVSPPLPTGRVAHVPTSITRDCSVDVSAALQTWIDSVPDNSTLAFAAGACYRIDETVEIDGRNRLLLDGNGATLKSVTTGSRDRAQLQLKGGSDLTVRNLIVRGANPHAGATAAAYDPALEAQAGFQLNGATDVLLDHVQVYDTYGDFVYIGPGDGQRTPSRNVTVANSIFDRSGRQGISVTWGVNVTIEANMISDVARSMFDLEANTRKAEIRNIRITGNVTGAAVNFWLANKGDAADIGSVQITGNRSDVGTGGLIFVYAKRGAYRGPYLVQGNRFITDGVVNDEGGSGALFFAYCDNVTIRDNVVLFPAGKSLPAVEVRNSHTVEVNGNQFTDAGRTVIASQGSTDVRTS